MVTHTLSVLQVGLLVDFFVHLFTHIKFSVVGDCIFCTLVLRRDVWGVCVGPSCDARSGVSARCPRCTCHVSV